MGKNKECLYHKENGSCRMESGIRCRYFDNGICPLEGDLSNGKNVKTKYESETARFTFPQLEGMGSF